MAPSLSTEWKHKWSDWKICTETKGFHDALAETFQHFPWKIYEKLTMSLNWFFPAAAEFFGVPYDTGHVCMPPSSQSFFIITGPGISCTQLCNVPALMRNTFILKCHL